MTEPGKEVQRWADEAMYAAAPMQLDHDAYGNIIPRVRLLWMTPDPLGAIAAMCRMYKGIPTMGLSEVSDDERRDYLVQVQKTHLQAPLEAVQLHFFIEGVTRSNTHQMVRQRTAVYAQESLRFAVKEEPFRSITSLPPSLAGTTGRDTTGDLLPSADKTQRWRDLWDRTVDSIESTYRFLIEDGMPAEDARGLIHHAITTRLHYNTNLRNLKEHAGNRLCTQAQFEWRLVFMGIVKAIREYADTACMDKYCEGGSLYTGVEHMGHRESYPCPNPIHEMRWQFRALADSGLFRPICYQLGKCQFEADFDRHCNIRDRVDLLAAHGIPSSEWSTDGFNRIDPAEWLLDASAARNTSGGGGHD